MTIMTRPFGEREIDEKQMITFPGGILGFETLKSFALLDAERPPFYWLQCIDEPSIAFVMINPYVFRADYVLEIPDGDLDEIGNPTEEEILVFAIVTVPSDGSPITANLQGPVIINRLTRLGRQSISLNPEWRTKHDVLDEMARRC